MTAKRRELALLICLLLAGCTGVQTAVVECQGDRCAYAIQAGVLSPNESVVVRAGDGTFRDLGSLEWANGSVERGVDVVAYRVDWENETIDRAVTCDTMNETCTKPPTATITNGNESLAISGGAG